MNNNKQFNDIYAFIQVAKLGSFTQAAAVLKVQPSALSHRINDLEKRLNIKLLNRTTRSVSTTEAGQQLFQRTLPMFCDIQDELGKLSDYADKICGKIRINCSERPAFEIIYPKIKEFLVNNSEVKLEIFINNLFSDIISERFDFGVRSGKHLARDMIAAQISAKNTMALVASPYYTAQFGQPKVLQDLIFHRCIVISLNPESIFNEWEFIQQKQIYKINVPDSIVFNSMALTKKSAIDGLGITWLPYDYVSNEIQSGQLVTLFPKLQITYPPMYLYYAKNRHKTPAMTALIEALKWKG